MKHLISTEEEERGKREREREKGERESMIMGEQRMRDTGCHVRERKSERRERGSMRVTEKDS
jgi:hypothetical protein